MATRENVEFSTLDGLKLAGWFFPAAEKGPAIIMTPGVGHRALIEVVAIH
jgi:hypothetical protein